MSAREEQHAEEVRQLEASWRSALEKEQAERRDQEARWTAAIQEAEDGRRNEEVERHKLELQVRAAENKVKKIYAKCLFNLLKISCCFKRRQFFGLTFLKEKLSLDIRDLFVMLTLYSRWT